MSRNKDQIRLSDHFTVGRLLRYCFPTMTMVVFTSIYGVVDGLFVSNFAGKSAFAAINLIMPALMILSAFGTMIGTGGTALISRTLGEDKKDLANRYFSILIEVAVIAGLFITLIGYGAMPWIVRFLGATPEMYQDAVIYGRTVIIFIVPIMLQYMFQTYMNLAEKPKLGLLFTVGAGVMNMILDAILVGAFDLGVTGAAVATGLAGIVGGIIPLIYFIRENDSPLQFKVTGIQLRPVWHACYNGVSELMTNISASIVSMVYNAQLLKYAGADGVAAYGVIMYVQFVFLGIMFGYTFGASPIIGFHYGARNHKELNSLLTKSMKIEYIGGVIMFLLAQLLARPVASLFVGYDAELLNMTVHAFRLFLFAFILSGGNMFTSAFFTSLSNGTVSAIISTVRTLVFELLAVLLLPYIFGLNGIWCAVFIAEVASAIMSWSFLFAENKKYHYFAES